MKHFTIENETNNITVYGSAKEADAVPDTERFSSEEALSNLAADWPAARLVEICNSLPGATPGQEIQGSDDGRIAHLESDSEPWRGPKSEAPRAATELVGEAAQPEPETAPPRTPRLSFAVVVSIPARDVCESMDGLVPFPNFMDTFSEGGMVSAHPTAPTILGRDKAVLRSF